jgi:hypothetical protein
VHDEVSIYGCRFKVASIGGVSTHPDHRGRGYASAILNESLDRMTRAGAKVLIVSGSRGLYRRAHCARAGRLFEVELSREQLEQPAKDLTVRRVTPEEWPLLAPLHQAEPVRFLRPADFLSRLCFWWDCYRPEIWLIESRRKPTAYLMVSWEDIRKPRAGALQLSEYAGSRAALLDSLPLILSEAQAASVRLRVLGHDREFLHLVRQRALDLKESTLSGTHRLLDVPGLMRKLSPYLAARLPRRELRKLSFHQQGEACAFTYGGETVDLSLSQAAPLVLGGFGAPPLPDALGQALSQIFPIPFPMPGFNYA